MMISPKIVIHGGAGNINRASVSPESRKEYLAALASILKSVQQDLESGKINALDTATKAVSLLENNPLFNAGKGAVFALDGTNELEASVMVSRGSQKRGVGVFLIKRTKNPVELARQLLIKDVKDGGSVHNGLSGEYADSLAEQWGLEMVDQKYYWTEKRWKEHLRGLPKDEKNQIIKSEEAMFDDAIDDDGTIYEEVYEREYLPKGTVGCVVLDVDGVIAVATSTGGLTNKLPGRIGDTPTLGCGFWAEEFTATSSSSSLTSSLLSSCLPTTKAPNVKRAVGISGTGNGDYFLRLAACHNIAARCRFGGVSLREAAKAVMGPGGEMELAGPPGQAFAGEGGVIGLDEKGDVVMEMNCGGMFRGTIDEKGRIMLAAFADEDLEEWDRV